MLWPVVVGCITRLCTTYHEYYFLIVQCDVTTIMLSCLSTAPLSLGTLRAMELDFSDDAIDDTFQESDYDGGSDSASHFLKPFVPLAVSPQKLKQCQRSIFADRTSSNHHYGSNVQFPLPIYPLSPCLELVLELWRFDHYHEQRGWPPWQISPPIQQPWPTL